MRYEIPVTLTTSRGAKNKAMIFDFIPTKPGNYAWVICEAANDDAAFAFVVRNVLPSDNRRVSGRSYIRKFRITPKIREELGGLAPINRLPTFKLGDPVVLHTPFTGTGLKPLTKGDISEVVNDSYYAISLHGYHNPFVDFSIREFAKQA